MAKSVSQDKKAKLDKKVTNKVASNGANGHDQPQRLNVQKTYKLYIGGKFPRTESGRYYKLKTTEGVVSISHGSRKDFRNSVVAARAAFKGWSSKTAYNRGQIVYRIAEMMEGRRHQFIAELLALGRTKAQAEKEVNTSIDRLVYYAGWADKYQQIFSSVNPVAASYFNFSMCEPTGVVAVIAPQDSGLIGLISNIIPAILGGNTVVALAAEKMPLCSITLAEVLNSSDVPGGVVNLMTGFPKEVVGHFSSHMDVNAIIYCGDDAGMRKTVQENAVENVKRVVLKEDRNWLDDGNQNPYFIQETQEIKTTWHPVGV